MQVYRLTIYHILRLLLLKITRDLHGLNDTCTPFVSTDLNSMSFLCAWLLAAHGHTVKCDGQRVLIHSTGTVYIWQDLAHLSTLLGSNISPTSRHFWVDDFPFPFGGICDRSLDIIARIALGFGFGSFQPWGPGKRLKKELLGRHSFFVAEPCECPPWMEDAFPLVSGFLKRGGMLVLGRCTLNDWFWKFLSFQTGFFPVEKGCSFQEDWVWMAFRMAWKLHSSHQGCLLHQQGGRMKMLIRTLQ